MRKILSYLGVAILVVFTMGCSNLSAEKNEQNNPPPQKVSSTKTIEKENEVFNSVPVFHVSAEEVYEELSETKSLKARINKDKTSADFSGENLYMVTTVYNHHDNKIDRFYIRISNTKFYNNNRQLNVVKNNFKELFKVLEVEYEESKLLDILKTKVKKDRENKIDSFPEDVKVFPYNDLWIGVEGIYNTNNEPEPNLLQVIIYPTKPE